MIGFMGLGNIGAPMAMRLVEGGEKLMVYDVRPEAAQPFQAKGAEVASSVRELADNCEVVIASLPSAAVFRQVVLETGGVLYGDRIRTFVNTSTVGATQVEAVLRVAEERGVEIIDCPISGGPDGARRGALSVMASGSEAAIEGLRPVLSLWGSVTVAGPKPGMAQVLKLVNNILAGVNLIATSEAMVMGAKAGLDPQVVLDAVNAGMGRNSATQFTFPKFILSGSFDFGASIDMMMKDIDLAISQGEALQVPMWVCQAARLVGKHAQYAGQGSDDMTKLIHGIESGAMFAIPTAANA